MIQAAPLIFRPLLKHALWGGTRICRLKGIPAAGADIGESWEISAVIGRESVVTRGLYKGMTLPELIYRFGSALLGTRVYETYGHNFPLLVKIIDASDNLSVQVHPDDRLARIRHNTFGKTEMWYVLEASPGARIYAGLNRKLDAASFEELVEKGEFASVVASHKSEAGDVYFLPAGCVHSIGAGNLLVEIQQSSDITYRIYDFDRRDAAGNKRELHTELAKDAIDYNLSRQYKLPHLDAEAKDVEIARCSHFTARRVLVDGPRHMCFDPGSFTIILCMEGACRLTWDNGQLDLRKGHTVLLPAILSEIEISGHATILTAQA
jgi:mannose-6-phosphate isomerase